MINFIRTSLVVLTLTSTLTACSGASSKAPRPLPEAMADRCAAASRALANAVKEGKHQPFVLAVSGAPTTTTWTEQQAAEHLLAGKPGGESWVIARGGSGKSRLAWGLEALTCGQRMTFRLDVGLDLRAKLEVATASKPALARVLLAQLGVRAGDDPAGQLHDELGESPWLLLLDGTDELSQSERRKLNAELEWLEKGEFGQHIVRFERPGIVEVHAAHAPEAILNLTDLSCAEADDIIARRFADPAVLKNARTWLTAHRLDRKRTGANCRYVHMSTHRDAETLADLAEDGLASAADPSTGLDDLPPDPVRTDIYATWLAHRLRGITSTADGAINWLDRIAAQGVVDKREPDLRLTVNRCEGVPSPGGADPGTVCRKLMQSAVVRKSEESGTVTLANRTLMDLLMARWLVKGQTDCALLTSATGEMASLEVAAMVASLPDGRRCLNPIVAAVCSRGIPADDILGFVDEAVPLSTRDPSFFSIASERAHGPCERAVFAGLQAK